MTVQSSAELPEHWNLTTDRLIIHRFLPVDQHADFVVALYNTPLAINGQGQTGIDTREKALKMIEGFVASRFEKYGHGLYLLSLKGETEDIKDATLIGSVTLMIGDHYTVPDVGFILLPEHTGKGYAQEAGRRMIEYAMTSVKQGGLGYSGVFGFTGAKNAKSRRVCESLGLEYRGVYSLAAFGDADSAVYAVHGMEQDLEVYGIDTKKRINTNDLRT